MKPFLVPAPLPHSPFRRACTLSVSRAELEHALGAPVDHDAEDGLGPRYRWQHSCSCGLELVVDVPRDDVSSRQEALVELQSLEVEHVLAHLDLKHDRVLWRADLLEPLPLEGWAVIRQDSHGNRHDLCVLPVRDHAECMARLLEARSPFQTYDVGPRGTPPLGTWASPPAPARRPRLEPEPHCSAGG